MKKVLVSGLLLVVLSATSVLMVYAGSRKKCSSDKKLSYSRERYCKPIKDAKTEVTNTDNGVIVKVTSNDPKVVKLIQECWAKKQKGRCAVSRSATPEEGSPKCKTELKSKKCPWQKPSESAPE